MKVYKISRESNKNKEIKAMSMKVTRIRLPMVLWETMSDSKKKELQKMCGKDSPYNLDEIEGFIISLMDFYCIPTLAQYKKCPNQYKTQICGGMLDNGVPLRIIREMFTNNTLYNYKTFLVRRNYQ